MIGETTVATANYKQTSPWGKTGSAVPRLSNIISGTLYPTSKTNTFSHFHFEAYVNMKFADHKAHNGVIEWSDWKGKIAKVSAFVWNAIICYWLLFNHAIAILGLHIHFIRFHLEKSKRGKLCKSHTGVLNMGSGGGDQFWLQTQFLCLRKMCARCAQDVCKMCARYVQNVCKMCARCGQYVCKMCARCLQDLCKVCPRCVICVLNMCARCMHMSCLMSLNPTHLENIAHVGS